MTEVTGFHRRGFGPSFVHCPGSRLHAQQFTGKELCYSHAGYSRPDCARTGVQAHGEALSPTYMGDGLAHVGVPLSVTSTLSPSGERSGTVASRSLQQSRFRGRLTVGPSVPTLWAGTDRTSRDAPVHQNTTGALPPTAEVVGFRAVPR